MPRHASRAKRMITHYEPAPDGRARRAHNDPMIIGGGSAGLPAAKLALANQQAAAHHTYGRPAR